MGQRDPVYCRKSFPASLVIDEIKCYEGDILPWRGTLCPSVDYPGGLVH